MPDSSTPPSQAKPRSAVRTIGTMIPLAVALAGGALHRSPVPPAGPPATSVTAPTTAANGSGPTLDGTVPMPLLRAGVAANWWFVFKLNGSAFPKCGTPSTDGGTVATPGTDARSPCLFDPTLTPPAYSTGFGQRYVYASDQSSTLTDGGPQCLGNSTDDPVGATFDEVYRGKFFFVVWNDQPYQQLDLPGCGPTECSDNWGHSKGMMAWNADGEGFVMQVSTPSWPVSASVGSPNKASGNTLGCMKDNDVGVSQHFFAMRLHKADMITVLQGLGNASVVTEINDPKFPQFSNLGGPPELVSLASALGKRSSSVTPLNVLLTNGVRMISKPNLLGVPPWQMVSSLLGGTSLRVASWWGAEPIPSTKAGEIPSCWNKTTLPTPPGEVDIALQGTWNKVPFSLRESPSASGNHAKLGVSTSGTNAYAIFGDMNQQGYLSGTCKGSQNGRGGMFYVMEDAQLNQGLTGLISGDPKVDTVPPQ